MRNHAVQRLERIATLSEVAMAIASGQDMRVTFKFILERTMATLRVDAADIVLVDETEDVLFVAASAGFAPGGELAYLCCHDDGQVFEFKLKSGRVTRKFPTAAGCEFIIAYQ